MPTTIRHCSFYLGTWPQLLHDGDLNILPMELWQVMPAREMDLLECLGPGMIAIVPNYKNPWRMVYSIIDSLFKSIIVAMDFIAKYRITTRIRTNLNSKCYFFIVFAIHKVPARIMVTQA